METLSDITFKRDIVGVKETAIPQEYFFSIHICFGLTAKQFGSFVIQKNRKLVDVCMNT